MKIRCEANSCHLEDEIHYKLKPYPPLNRALKRNHYPLPVMDDLLPQPTNAKVFSVVDAKNGFWQVQLDEESSYLTTFGTPWGRYRWTRMPFGISPAPEEFQRRLEHAVEGLDGVMPIFDDIIAYGVGDTEAEAMSNHEEKLRALFECCRTKNIKLNRDKLKLRLTEVKFMGHVISEEGLKADPDKVQGIKEMLTPTSKQDIKRILGMVNYLQKFAPNLSDVTAPMRELLKEANQFCWDEQIQGKSFEQVKKIISEAPVFKFFDPKEEVELQCDASDRGLGACLMQGGQLVAYASRLLKPTVPEDIGQKMKLQKAKQSIYYNKGAKELEAASRRHHNEFCKKSRRSRNDDNEFFTLA
ncbi:hypothetical protein QZH41_004601 [Actinostola sp. cb2023]|nr:hypothetical protein QZH41_004601 [Actinostola sp. cb2023]